MNSDSCVASNVASFRSIRTGRNVQVQPASKVAYPGDMGATNPLSCQYAEIVFRDESSKVLEPVGHECRRLTSPTCNHQEPGARNRLTSDLVRSFECSSLEVLRGQPSGRFRSSVTPKLP
jgi:hypothetical protein